MWIVNNLFMNCVMEDWGCVGIVVGYVCEIIVEYNELNDLLYMVVSVGWGWICLLNLVGKNCVYVNCIFNIVIWMVDIGGIYMFLV